MASSPVIKACEVSTEPCTRQSRALCFHCSKNLCRIHLEQHAQLMEETTRAELNSLADTFNELSLKFSDLAVTSAILEQPFPELEKWRCDAHQKIDQIADQKRQEIKEQIEEYKKAFIETNHLQMEKISADKRMIADLILDTDASNQQIADLRKSIDIADKYLNALTTHKINVRTRPAYCFVEINTQSFQPQQGYRKLREFKVTYVRLDGIVRHYHVKTEKDGAMCDLIRAFIQQYPLFEMLTRFEANLFSIPEHQPAYDRIQPAEVYDRRIRRKYVNTHQLTAISRDETICFYETAYSLNAIDQPNLLVSCSFRRLPHRTPFAWPLYLVAPHEGGKGQHIWDALRGLFASFFPSDLYTGSQPYEVFVEELIWVRTGEQKQNRVLNQASNVKSTDVFVVDVASEIADRYEQNMPE